MHWLHNNHDTLITRLVPGIGVHTEIFLRHRINKIQIGVLINAYNLATDLQITIDLIGISYREGNLGITFQVAIFLPSLCQAKQYMLTIPAKPDRTALRLPLWANRRYM